MGHTAHARSHSARTPPPFLLRPLRRLAGTVPRMRASPITRRPPGRQGAPRGGSAPPFPPVAAESLGRAAACPLPSCPVPSRPVPSRHHAAGEPGGGGAAQEPRPPHRPAPFPPQPPAPRARPRRARRADGGRAAPQWVRPGAGGVCVVVSASVPAGCGGAPPFPRGGGAALSVRLSVRRRACVGREPVWLPVLIYPGGGLGAPTLPSWGASVCPWGTDSPRATGRGKGGFGRVSAVPWPRLWPLLASCWPCKRHGLSAGVRCAQGQVNREESERGRGVKRATAVKNQQKAWQARPAETLALSCPDLIGTWL